MTPEVRLRDTTVADVDIFHRHRQEAEAARRANIATPDHGTYVDYWSEHILSDESADVQTVTADGQVVGWSSSWPASGPARCTPTPTSAISPPSA